MQHSLSKPEPSQKILESRNQKISMAVSASLLRVKQVFFSRKKYASEKIKYASFECSNHGGDLSFACPQLFGRTNVPNVAHQILDCQIVSSLTTLDFLLTAKAFRNCHPNLLT